LCFPAAPKDSLLSGKSSHSQESATAKGERSFHAPSSAAASAHTCVCSTVVRMRESA
jgi:hypothetical protein